MTLRETIRLYLALQAWTVHTLNEYGYADIDRLRTLFEDMSSRTTPTQLLWLIRGERATN